MKIGDKVKFNESEFPFLGEGFDESLKGQTFEVKRVFHRGWNGISELEIESIEGDAYGVLDNGTVELA